MSDIMKPRILIADDDAVLREMLVEILTMNGAEVVAVEDGKAAVAEAMTGQRLEVEAERLLALLTQADASRGQHQPGLSVGRDGITLGVRCQGGRVYEVASTATVSVLDRISGFSYAGRTEG